MRIKHLSQTLLLAVGLVLAVTETGPAQTDTATTRLVFSTGLPADALYCDSLHMYLGWQFLNAWVDAPGNSYVLLIMRACPWADSSTINVIKFDPSGHFRWSKKVEAKSEAVIADVAADQIGNVYVTEEHSPVWCYPCPLNEGTKIESFSRTGVRQWSDLYRGPAEVGLGYRSAAVATDDSTHVYVTSWDRDDSQLLAYGANGAGPHIVDLAPFDDPSLIRVGPYGEVVLFGSRVSRFSSQGDQLSSSSTLGQILSAGIDGKGNIYCVSFDNYDYSAELSKLDTNCNVVWQKSFPHSGAQPTLVTVDWNGTAAIISTSCADMLQQMAASYSPEGSLNWYVELDDTLTIAAAAAVDILGNCYVLYTDSGLASYNPDGDLRWKRPLEGITVACGPSRIKPTLDQSYLYVDGMGDVHVAAPVTDIASDTIGLIQRITQPKTFDIVDAKGDSIPNTEFNLIRVHNDPPFYTEDTLGAFTTNFRGQFEFPFAGVSGYLFEASPTNPVKDTLYPGDTIKIARMVDLVFAARHQSLLGSAYSIHLDNQKFTAAGRPVFDTVQYGSTQQIALRHTEHRYNLLASVEWDAELAYLNGLTADFRQMSNYLYDVSDGQIRLDTVMIVDNKSNWLDADVRIVAQNTYWPDADIMGIGMTGLSPITMPRKWCGSPDSSRINTYLLHPLSQELSDNYRTLVHELGHYGLAFYDEWLFADPLGKDVPIPTACPPDPAGNFGFMSSQYDSPSSGDHASEMSSIYRYQTPGCINTRQMVFCGRSCWDDFEHWAERCRNGIYVPILKPSLTDKQEQLTPTGVDYFPGPNDDLYALDYDVGALVHFPIVQAPPSLNHHSIRVLVTGAPLGGVGINVLRNGSKINSVDQGFTDDSGRIWALGVDQFADVITASGYVFATSLATMANSDAGESAMQRGWLYGSSSLNGEDSVTLTMDSVNGYYPLTCQASLSDNGWEYELSFDTEFVSPPEYAISCQSGATVSGQFTSYPDGYITPLASYLTESGDATISALDAAGKSFFFKTPFAVKDITAPSELRKVIGASGDAVAWLDTANIGIRKVMVLSSPYPPMLLGLDPGALQGGQTHSISGYPVTGLVGGNVLSIGYTNRDLRNENGTVAGLESLLRIYRWTGPELGWTLIGGIVDTVRNLVSTSITEAGTYGAFTINSYSSCCNGTRGNVNMQGIVDLTDLSLLVSYLTVLPRPVLPCPNEANVNGSGLTDLSDLSLLIGYLTVVPRPTLPDCP